MTTTGHARPGTPPPTRARQAFHLLAKPTGAACNLDCAYCFFLSKQALYPGSEFRMTDDLLELYLRELLAAHLGTPEVVVAWQGGEPALMGLDFFRRSVELAESLRQPYQRVTHTIQTNGTLLNDEWGEFLARHGFLVGISIDGPRDMHDAYRADKAGRGSFSRVIRGLDVLRRHGVAWNALCAVHAANQNRGREVYRFLRDHCGARFIQFIPIVERADRDALRSGSGAPRRGSMARPDHARPGEEATGRSVSPSGYGRFLIDVFEDWVRRDVGEVFVRMFDVALANWFGERSDLCVHSKTCGLALVLEHNGDLYSCDHFVEPAYRLGNVTQHHLANLAFSPAQRAFGDAKRDGLPPLCRGCGVRFACHGGCPKDRFAITDGQTVNYLCPSYSAFFAHIRPAMETMCDLLRTGRPPSLIVRDYAAHDARRGRNEPCPCGSGGKWKRCHGGFTPGGFTPAG